MIVPEIVVVLGLLTCRNMVTTIAVAMPQVDQLNCTGAVPFQPFTPSFIHFLDCINDECRKEQGRQCLSMSSEGRRHFAGGVDVGPYVPGTPPTRQPGR